MKYRGIFEYEYPTEHKPPVSIDVHLHGDCVKGKIIEWEYRPLEQEPTTKNDLGVDAVSRQEVLYLIADYDLSMGQVVKGIHALPSVTSQERKGHWISHREHCENLGVMPSGLGAYEWCSNCDCGIDVREWHRNYYNFCPNCGCRMIEPQESEDKV